MAKIIKAGFLATGKAWKNLYSDQQRLTDFCCLTSMEARRPIWDGDEWESGTEEWNLETGVNPEDRAAVDRHQNNRTLRQCPSGIAQWLQHHAIAVPTAMQSRVTMTMSVAPLLGNNRSRRSPTLSIAQHHLPVLDLFLANFLLRVQLTSLLLISPGLSTQYRHKRDNLL